MHGDKSYKVSHGSYNGAGEIRTLSLYGRGKSPEGRVNYDRVPVDGVIPMPKADRSLKVMKTLSFVSHTYE